jgi:hypothetical protein
MRSLADGVCAKLLTRRLVVSLWQTVSLLINVPPLAEGFPPNSGGRPLSNLVPAHNIAPEPAGCHIGITSGRQALKSPCRKCRPPFILLTSRRDPGPPAHRSKTAQLRSPAKARLVSRRRRCARNRGRPEAQKGWNRRSRSRVRTVPLRASPFRRRARPSSSLSVARSERADRNRSTVSLLGGGRPMCRHKSARLSGQRMALAKSSEPPIISRTPNDDKRRSIPPPSAAALEAAERGSVSADATSACDYGSPSPRCRSYAARGRRRSPPNR